MGIMALLGCPFLSLPFIKRESHWCTYWSDTFLTPRCSLMYRRTVPVRPLMKRRTEKVVIMESAIEILHSMRIQDICDIIIVAVMISALLIWFKDRASRFVFVGIGFLGLIYILARFFQLYLTTIVLQGFFAILIFVLVIIFQEDLRRFFERIAMWGGFRKKLHDNVPADGDVGTITRTVARLAQNRTGALIVIRGDDPLDRHLSQGTMLDGILSQPLLESIFDPHSPGHDGAAVVEGGKVVEFGCHLPLSVHEHQLGGHGLRHAAALGLAERSDAICIVVSEERGTISIALGEKLLEVADVSELQSALASFFAKKAPPKQPHPIIQWFREHSREKVIAVLLACVLWLIFGYQRESIQRELIVPIEYTSVSPEWVIEEPKVAEVKVLLRGSPQAFQLLKPETLKISLDLSQIDREKQEFILMKDMVRVPSNLSVDGIQPGQISIIASRLTFLSVPIEIVTENTPTQGRVIQSIYAVPSSIRVLVPRKLARERIRIQTSPIDLKAIKSTMTLDPKLIFPPGVQFEGGQPPSVQVFVKIRKKASHPQR